MFEEYGELCSILFVFILFETTTFIYSVQRYLRYNVMLVYGDLYFICSFCIVFCFSSLLNTTPLNYL